MKKTFAVLGLLLIFSIFAGAQSPLVQGTKEKLRELKTKGLGAVFAGQKFDLQ